MRAWVCSVVLWAVLTFGMAPVSVYAEPAGEGLNPVAQGILQHLFEQLQQQNETQAPDQTGDPPPGGNDTTGQGDDVQAGDRSPPVIRAEREEFVSSKSTVYVRATITDDRGVAGAGAIGDEIKERMTEEGPTRYVAALKLPPNYQPVGIRVVAWDRSNNRARPVPVVIRRVPACGVTKDVSVRIVGAVQEDLARLGLYEGEIDGLAGPMTCAAVEAAGIGGDFFWPDVLKQIDALAGLRSISLVADAPEVTYSEVNAIRVRVKDPGETGRVALVRMLVDGRQVDVQANETGELGFLLMIAEGARHRVRFEALDRDRSGVLAETTLVVTRPAPLSLELAAPELSGARIESDTAQVLLLAEIIGARTGRIAYENSDGAVGEIRTYSGAPVRFVLTMPPPGERSLLVFRAASENRRTPPRRIELHRIRVVVPDVPVLTPQLSPAPVADPPPVWHVAPTAPPERPLISPPPRTPVADDPPPRPATAPPIPTPAPPGLPEWLAPVGVAVMLVFGMIAGMISLFRHGFRRHKLKRPKTTLIARVEVVPDKTPEIEVAGAELPGLILTVDPGVQGPMELEFDKELEGADP